MKLPNIDKSQFIPTSVMIKEIERAENADLLNTIKEINSRFESEQNERIESEIKAEKKNKRRFLISTAIAVLSFVVAAVAAAAAVIAII